MKWIYLMDTNDKGKGRGITVNERSLLIAIRDSDFQDGNDPVDNYVWVDCLDGWSDTRKFPGTMSSLVKKGLAKSDGDACAITQAGFDALEG
jgi:hypothetical protein